MLTFSDFFESLGELDWLGIIVATLVVFVVGGLVFGPLFGKKWAAAAGMPYEGMKFDAKRDIPAVILTLIFQIGVAYLGPYDDIEHALVAGLIFGILLLGSALYSQTLWLKRNRTAVFIEMFYSFLAVAVGIYVQGLMA